MSRPRSSRTSGVQRRARLFSGRASPGNPCALKLRLALTAAVRRDGVWANRPAAELVPGDVVKLSLGAVVAADVRLVEGGILLDQSMLTGESIPVEAGPGFQTYAGALVRRGEAVAEVTATGTRTKFGRTAELVLSAHVVSSQQKAVLRVVRNLALFNGSLIVLLVAYAAAHAMPLAEIIPLVLTAVLASIPVRCRPPLPWRRLSAHDLWHTWAFCRRVSPRWTRPHRWMSCAWTRRAR